MGNCIYIGNPPQSWLESANDHSPTSLLRKPDSSIKLVQSCNGRVYELAVGYNEAGEAVATQVAELMLDFPSTFLVQLDTNAAASDIRSNINRRPPAMPADAELEPGNAYLLLPMYRMHCRLSDEEIERFMEALTNDETRASAPKSRGAPIQNTCHRFSHNTKVAPLSVDPALHGQQEPCCSSTNGITQRCDEPGDGATDGISNRREAGIKQHQNLPSLIQQQGMVCCRSRWWAPKLETVSENLISI